MSWAVLGLEWEPEEAWGRPWEENIGKPKENHRFLEAQGGFYDMVRRNTRGQLILRIPAGWQLLQEVEVAEVSHGVRPQGASRILSASRTPAGQRNA